MHTISPDMELLQDIASFSKVRRYKGMLPSKLTLFYDESRVEELITSGYIERLIVSYPCGSEPSYLRLTNSGEEMLQNLGISSAPQKRSPKRLVDDLTEEQLLLLNDLFHYAQVTCNGGMAPISCIEAESLKDLNMLLTKGYALRVKTESGKGKKRKGLVLTEKGLLTLHAANQPEFSPAEESSPASSS